MHFINLLILILILDTSWSWKTIDDIDDTSPSTSNDAWAWETFKNDNNEEEEEEEEDDAETFPEKLQPLTNNNWSWQSNSENNKIKDDEYNKLPYKSHRTKKEYTGTEPADYKQKELPKISVDLYKAILGESKSFQEVVNSILNPALILQQYYSIFADKNFQKNIQKGDLDEAKTTIEQKLCELGLMKCVQTSYPTYDDNRYNDLYASTKPFVFENSKSKREVRKYPQKRQAGNAGSNAGNSRLVVNNYGSYGQNELGSTGGGLSNLANLGALSGLPQTFASLSQKNIAPTVGFSFGLPIPTGAYPFNVLGGGVPAVNPYFGSLGPNGVKLGLINVNPLVSVQYAKDEYGDKVIKPLVHLHITPNENIVSKVSGYLKAKKQEALYNYHHHHHEHEFQGIAPPLHPYPPIAHSGPPFPPSYPPSYPHISHSGPPFLPPYSPSYPHISHSGPPPFSPTYPQPIQHDYVPPVQYYNNDYQLHQFKQLNQKHEHEHHHHYDDEFNSKFLSSAGPVEPNYQYGIFYPYTNENVVKHHISEVAPTTPSKYYLPTGSGVDSTHQSYGTTGTVGTNGYQSVYGSGADSTYQSYGTAGTAGTNGYQSGYGNGVDSTYQSYGGTGTAGTNGYQSGYPTGGYEDYYGINRKSGKNNYKRKGKSSDSGKLKFPEGRTVTVDVQRRSKKSDNGGNSQKKNSNKPRTREA